MKSIHLIIIAAFSLAGASPLLAQDLLQNADLADGTLHWEGNCKVAGADDSTDLTTTSSDAKGITVDLHSSSWTTVKQVIRNLKAGMANAQAHLVVQYKISPDFSLSTRDSDYSGDDTKSGIGTVLGFEVASIHGRPGQIMAFIDNPPKIRSDAQYIYLDNISMQSFTPATGDAKTFQAGLVVPYNGTDDPVFCIAIPPGHGSITITKISLLP